MTRRLESALLALAAALVGAACSSNPDSSGLLGGGVSESTGSNGNPGSAGGLGGDASASGSCTGGDLAGCGCSEGTRACFSVSAGLRNQNGCKDGVQTCVKHGVEFATWGPCTGEVATCTAPVPQADAGAEQEAGVDAAPPQDECQCYPGAVRWCDSPVMCDWGKQTCMPDGTWGSCSETWERPPGCGSILPFSEYDESCCARVGECCQDYNSMDRSKSVGTCDQIACPSHIVVK